MAHGFRIISALLFASFNVFALCQNPILALSANYTVHLSHVLVADLQSDNAPELIGLDSNSNSLVVMVNLDDGTYGAPHYYGLSYPANGVAVGDFNGDGKLDVAVALSVNDGTRGYVAVLLNAGHGALNMPVYHQLSVGANSIAVGDFNHDGRQDIAIAANENSGAVNKVVILTNTGSGFSQRSLAAPIYFGPQFGQAQADSISNIVAGDFNGDNRADLAYLDSCSQCDVAEQKIVLLVNTTSGWQAKMLPIGGRVVSGVFQMTAADVDGDGRSDLLTPFRGCYTPCIGVGVFYMDKDLVAPTEDTLPVGNFGEEPVIEQVVVGDLNNDGLLDIAGYAQEGSDQNFNELRPGIMAWTASGKRAFNQPKYYEQAGVASGVGAAFIASGFLNKDGKRDLVIPWGADLQVWTNSTIKPNDPCPNPTSGGIHVCAPVADVASGSVHFIASARTNVQPLQRFELWVDGRRRWVLTSDRMDLKLSIPNGAHQAQFVEVGASSLSIKKTISFHVGQ